jgi:hypothetical protein
MVTADELAETLGSLDGSRQSAATASSKAL